MLHNDFYVNERTAIIGIFSPLQENHPYFDYICYSDTINIKEETKDADVYCKDYSHSPLTMAAYQYLLERMLSSIFLGYS